MNAEIVSRTAADEWPSLLGREGVRNPEAAFVLLVERQSRFAFKVAYAVLRNVEDAEDVVQDTFLKLFRTGAWKQIRDEKGFLARVAWRLAVSRARSKRQVPQPEASEIAAEEDSPEKACLVSERSRTIHRVITTPEIAAVMDLPEGTVRRLLMEARTLLKEKISRMEARGNG
jgi:RNA polymerase sigma-70 factor (ECF subfamily)